jgi:hypothetical protein
VALKARVLTLVLALAGTVGCRSKPKPPERTEPWLASASATAPGAPLARRAAYRLGKAKIEFELPARRGNPRGQLHEARGNLDIDLDDLSHTTGSVMVDLGKLEIYGEAGGSDATSTTRALDWLELGSGVAPEKRDAARNASFAISSLDAGHVVSAPGRDGRAPRRELNSNFSVRGELSLHGVRAPVTVEASLTFVMGVNPDAPPAELLIRSRRPLVIGLSTHDIRPRDDHGVPIAKDLGLLGEQVGTTAKITFDLTFVPGS